MARRGAVDAASLARHWRGSGAAFAQPWRYWARRVRHWRGACGTGAARAASSRVRRLRARARGRTFKGDTDLPLLRLDFARLGRVGPAGRLDLAVVVLHGFVGEEHGRCARGGRGA
eukprot:872028-Prymnesium_polylepis.1